MRANQIELQARARRLAGLKIMLRSLEVYALVFSLQVVINGENKSVGLSWSAQDRMGGPVEFQSINLQHYLKDLCFLVRNNHEMITGRWVWWVTDEDDIVENVPGTDTVRTAR